MFLSLQAGNNLLIVQSPGQPAVVQQVQLVQPKADSQLVQIPQQALKVVQAASATLPPVPQRQPVSPNLQTSPTEPTPTQVSAKCQSRAAFSLNLMVKRIYIIKDVHLGSPQDDMKLWK